MSKKGKKQSAKQSAKPLSKTAASEANDKSVESSADSYYDLKTEAVEKLVNAKDAPEVSEAELRKYRSGGKHRIPTWLKIVFVKFWFSGAMCYFFIWGLGNYIQGLDMMAAVAIGMGLVTDLLVNHFLRALEPEPREYDKWMMVTVRKWWSMILNVIYAALLLFCIVQSYTAINTLLYGDPETSENILGVEPLLFGVLYVLFDMLFIGIKNGFKIILRDAERKVSGEKK